MLEEEYDSLVFQAILLLEYPEYSQILCTSARFSKLCFAGVHPVSASPLPFLSYFPVNQQYDGCFVPLAWMLMAGLQGFASNGKIL